MNDDSGLREGIESGLLSLLPLALCLALLLFSLLPFGLPGLRAIAPSLVMIAIFYWTVYRPDLMPLSAGFAIGVIQDLIVGTPLGLSAAMLVVVQAAVSSQRQFFLSHSFRFVWIGFATIALGANALGWVAAMVYNGALIEPRSILFQALLTIALYPCLSVPFGVLRRELPYPG